MKLKWISLFSIIALLAMWMPSQVHADVRDNAQIFTQDAVDSADRDMKAMEHKHNKQLVVETFAAVPDDQKDAAKADPKNFFNKWMGARAKELKVNGVYVLICLDPRHLDIDADDLTTSRKDFTYEDRSALYKQMQGPLKEKEYDQALTGAVEMVERTYTENIKAANGRAAAQHTAYGGGYPQGNTPPVYAPPTNYNPGSSSSGSSGLGLGFGALLCMIVGGIIIVSLIRSIFRGGSVGGFGGGGYNPGNQGYGGNYGGGGYGYGGGGGGSGFGRGFLGGLLGGAVGSYAENRFEQRDNNQGNSGFFGGGGGGSSNDTSNSGTSSFDSGPSDPGQGFSDNSTGGDFGSSGGGDSGGGGGGSTGGDF